MDRHLAVACLSLADGSGAGEITGAWLVRYNPAGNDGHGEVTWSHGPPDAARYTAEERAGLYAAGPASRSLRPDGKPNRPITELNAMVVPVDPGALPSVLPVPGPACPPHPPDPPRAEPVSLTGGLRALGLR